MNKFIPFSYGDYKVFYAIEQGFYQTGNGDVSNPDKCKVNPFLVVQRRKGDHAPGSVEQNHRLRKDVNINNFRKAMTINRTFMLTYFKRGSINEQLIYCLDWFRIITNIFIVSKAA